MNGWITLLIDALQHLPNEALGVLIYFTAIGALFLFHRYFGKEGLFIFIVLAVVIANIQCLKAVKLAFFSYPIAMGTTLFTTALLATDILAEYYGRKQAEKAIWLGFAGMLMVSLLMLLTLGAKTITAAAGTPLAHYTEVHEAMMLLFAPAPALLLASLIAYLVSQYTDMLFFLWLKKYTQGRFLPLRTLCTTLLSALVDNCIFSTLAWKIFYPLPIDFQTFLATYIFGTFGLRALIGFANTSFIHFISSQNQTRNQAKNA